MPWEYVEPIYYLFGRYGRGLSVEDAGEEQALLRTYLPNTSKGRRARIDVGVNLVRILQPLEELEVADLEEADWENAWKAHFSLLKVGKRLAIKPSWIDYTPSNDEVVIELDPGLAFGTGYHPTTKMCLEAMEELVEPGMKVLDLGTGSGILAITAAMLGASSVFAMDIDPSAVKAARKNFKASGLYDIISLVRGTLPNRQAPEASFDLATTNISARVIGEKAPNFCQSLKPGGILVVSGIIETQLPELRQTLEAAGLSHIKTSSVEDWVALLLRRPDTDPKERAR